MDLYYNTFQEALTQNEIDQKKWISFKNKVSETRETINTFLKSYKLDILVPIGRKAFIRGQLQHTNDILMAHNSSYFSLMSNSQANEILNMRTNACNERIKAIEKERDLFKGKLDVANNDVFSQNEIIEEYDEKVEAEWLERHRESVKRQKLLEAEERSKESVKDIDELLDKYELLEEMTDELENLEIEGTDSSEVISKLMTGDIKMYHPKERISHDTLNMKRSSSEQEALSKVEKSSKKRKVKFSSSLEDIKIINSITENKEKSGCKTISITFQHSPGRFDDKLFSNEDNSEELFKHPGEIYQRFKEQSVNEVKSILKDTGYIPDISINKTKVSNEHISEDEEEIPIPVSSFPLVCTDQVIERKNIENTVNESKVNVQPKRISKFKEMRSKIKS
ncbi:hypothetical protein PVAND_007989 [Polypedilum vanderplanki]|uniref:Unconventional prefoldin RPB5 interactor n=1 Tax=Polypedilum vanderplanki TaxID=319348 RepID=A0A9J6C9I4_POLVA|nr:hypothetical protein PVAND_007989 [Polypedilum vanderplanki]